MTRSAGSWRPRPASPAPAQCRARLHPRRPHHRLQRGRFISALLPCSLICWFLAFTPSKPSSRHSAERGSGPVARITVWASSRTSQIPRRSVRRTMALAWQIQEQRVARIHPIRAHHQLRYRTERSKDKLLTVSGSLTMPSLQNTTTAAATLTSLPHHLQGWMPFLFHSSWNSHRISRIVAVGAVGVSPQDRCTALRQAMHAGWVMFYGLGFRV